MTVRVVNKRAWGAKPEEGETIVYIGRPSVLGNPFPLEKEKERQEVIEKYRSWLQSNYEENPLVRTALEKLAARVKAGESIALQCWCEPKKCHGDVIVEFINKINSEK